MSGQRKPGDVGLVTCSDGKERIAICGERWLDDFLVWVFRDKTLRDVAASDARPLVLIDPEDAEQVKRFADVYAVPQGLPEAGPAITAAMTAALREFAAPTPPKPAEPTGLGAVVEDEDGKRWVRTADTDCTNPWQRAHAFEDVEYPAIGAVRVLSEGVTA